MQRTLASSLVLTAMLAAGGGALAQDASPSGTPGMGTNQSSSGTAVDREDSRYDGTSASPGGAPAPNTTGTGTTGSTYPGSGVGNTTDSGSGEDETGTSRFNGSTGGGTAPGATTPGSTTPGSATPGSGAGGSTSTTTTP